VDYFRHCFYNGPGDRPLVAQTITRANRAASYLPDCGTAGEQSMAYEFILTERVDGAAVITLNRPEKLNALSYPLVRELDDALTEYEADDDIKAVILTGAGDRAFSAGADIHEMAGLSPEELATRADVRGRATWHIATFGKPLIGAINGLAYGGAALLSSTLDLRIGCERTAFRFLAASYGRVNSTWSLPLLVGLAKTKELLYTGRVVNAEEAERIGLLNQVVPAARLLDTCIEIAQMIAKNDARMVRGIKRLLHEQIGMDWRERYDNEEEARGTWLAAGHPREGFKDFLSRKKAG
jgi:2-(1,2-epoxy-1,2-dihydrophenyl)acetyl-CoA isomerase